MPLRNWTVYTVAFLFAVGAAWAFIAANAVPEAGKRAGGNHGFRATPCRATSKSMMMTLLADY